MSARHSLRSFNSSGFPIPLTSVGAKGGGLVRPECVLTTQAGELFTADWRGGVAHIRPDGSQILYKASLADGHPILPNGIALLRDRCFLIAHLGEELGGVFKLSPDGSVRPMLLEVDGIELPPSNFVAVDQLDRIWVTVSTRHRPRILAWRDDVADGFIVLVDKKGARIVADGLGYTNEALVSPDGRYLYVNETVARRLTRFSINEDGSLSSRETITTFGKGTFPDGLAFDAEGGIWITSIVSNRIIRVMPDGSQQLVLEDADDVHISWVEAAFQNGTMGRLHLDRCGEGVLKNISSLAFGGPDLRTVYLGCLLGDSIAWFISPVAGHPPRHWHY